MPTISRPSAIAPGPPLRRVTMPRYAEDRIAEAARKFGSDRSLAFALPCAEDRPRFHRDWYRPGDRLAAARDDDDRRPPGRVRSVVTDRSSQGGVIALGEIGQNDVPTLGRGL